MTRRTGVHGGLALAVHLPAATPTVGSVRVESVVLLGWTVVLAVVGALLVGRYAPRFVAALESFAGGVVAETPDEPPPERRRRSESPDEPSEDGPDPSPPSTDQERVLELLAENGGRLPQGEIVARTPWSKSKVSRLLARMDVQDRIVKIRAGRENIIVLPGEEPAALKSPTDRESEQN